VKKSFNPFLTNGYISPALFCDRKNEVKELYGNVKNGIDTTLISPRRMGKTGLIFHFFNFLDKKRNINAIYVDIYAARSLNDFIKLLAEATMRKFPEKTTIGKRFLTLIKGLRPLISYDAISGEPQLQIAYQSIQEQEYTLQGLLQFLENQSMPIVVAIDEFQQITQFPEQNVEALLRTNIQHLKNVQFIFCGSRKDMMTAMFSNAKRPFFSSTQYLSLEKIEYSAYASFIKQLFEKDKIKIEQDAIDFILTWTKCHTFFTQSVCNMTYQMSEKKVNLENVKAACAELLKRNEPVFFQYRQMLTPAQWNFLLAVAKEGEVKQITSKKFINKYNIGGPSDARRISQSLIEKELLLEIHTKTETTYQVYDLFLSRWLEREY
jgi:AAA+ ATPase superfamily predicted ATPase